MSGHSSNDGPIVLYVILILVALFIGVGRGVFASQDVAVRTLQAQGYSNIQIVDHAWFAVGFRGCDKKDAARFTAKATNPAGKPAEVYVCAGVIFKGGTVRVR
ncbi:MAG: hypothetical protein HYY55_02795 [Candidatus Niyogibacteria bacterium]|nr:MAG: hypothetical protein HYY55_02795 [Candidatus Niyogibacteria bacterium]